MAQVKLRGRLYYFTRLYLYPPYIHSLLVPQTMGRLTRSC